MLDSMDVARAVCSDDDEEASMVRVLSKKSETRTADEDSEARKTSGPRGGEDSIEMSWYSILGTSDGIGGDSGRGANRSDTEPKWLGSKLEGESEWGTRGDGVNEGDAGADEDEPWDVGETAGLDATGIVDDGEELGTGNFRVKWCGRRVQSLD